MRVVQDQSGSPLLEVLIGVFLFGLSMCGLAQLGYASVLSNKASQVLTDATTLAQDRIEKVRNVGYDNADTTARTENYGQVPGEPTFKRVTAVVAGPVGSNTKSVTVVVFWRADQHRFELRTLLTK